MHELSLACSVVELVEKELALHGGGSVRCIEITIGDLSGVDNDAFFIFIEYGFGEKCVCRCSGNGRSGETVGGLRCLR